MVDAIINNEYFKSFVSYNQEELATLVKLAVNDNEKDKIIIIKTAFYVGLDPNWVYPSGISLFHCILEIGDISAVAHFIKNNVDIYKKSYNNYTALHFCARDGHKHLLQFFIEKKIDINQICNDGNTPLIIAVITGNIECVELLLSRKADITIVNKDNFTAFTLILLLLKSELTLSAWDRYLSVFKLITNATSKINRSEIKDIIRIIHKEQLSVMKILVTKFPHIINLSCDEFNHTLLALSIVFRKPDFINYFLNLKNLDMSKINKFGMTYLHMLANNLYFDQIKVLVGRCPSLINSLCIDGRTAIEYAIIPTENTPFNKPDKDIITIVKYLVSLGININSRNNFELRSIECSIQYRSVVLVKAMIKLGADISGKMRHTNMYSPVTNNDLIGFASQFGRDDIVKLLLDIKAVIQIYHIKEISQSIPGSVISAICNMRENCLSLLLKHPEISTFMNTKVNKYLFGLALQEGCTDKTILVHFADPNLVRNIKFDNKFLISGLDTFLSRHIASYNTKRIHILKGLFLLLSLLYKIFTFHNKKDIYRMFNLIENLYDNIAGDLEFVDKLVAVVVVKINHPIKHDIQLCIDTVRNLQDNFDINIAVEKIKKLSSLLTPTKILAINDLYKTVTLALSKKYIHINDDCDDFKDASDQESDNSDQKSDEEPDDEPDELTIKESNKVTDVLNIDSDEFDTIDNNDVVDTKIEKPMHKSIDKSFGTNLKYDHSDLPIICRALFKLNWPIRLKHYDFMMDKLINIKDVCIKNSSQLSVATTDNIISTIFSFPGFTKPSIWFKSYAPNIGRLDKCDDNHMFSFMLDSKLRDWPCIEKRVIDPIHINKYDKLFYFYGEFETKENLAKHRTEAVKVRGCYEYFINGYNTLFHRFFRPYDTLPVDIKKLLPLPIVT
jgi:ankyrin repeat protein